MTGFIFFCVVWRFCMRITIDTKTDTKEEILEVIEFLKKLYGQQSSNEGESAFGSIYGEPEKEEKPSIDIIEY